jgi:hypothetical protein
MRIAEGRLTVALTRRFDNLRYGDPHTLEAALYWRRLLEPEDDGVDAGCGAGREAGAEYDGAGWAGLDCMAGAE